MVRCYDCGNKIPEGQVCRMTVHTGTSVGRHGPRFYHRKVNLCPVCTERRAARAKVLWIIAGVLSVLFALVLELSR